MKRWIVALLTGLVLLLGVTSAVGRSPAPTTITYESTVDLGDGKSLLSGQVTSHREICQFFRIVKLKAHYPNGRTQLLDDDISSAGGAWAMKADLSGADRLKAKVTKVVVSAGATAIVTSGGRPGATHHPPGHHKAHHGHHRRVLCEAASVAWGLD
ncbi:MAG: hypothetical protein ACRDMH_01100 [Solirubrobacterales bacterium]